MADHGTSSQPVVRGLESHRATYESFILWSVAAALHCFFILVALVDFRFVDAPFSLFVGFGGIIIGSIVTLIALFLGGKWLMPVVVLVLYALFVAANAHLS